MKISAFSGTTTEGIDLIEDKLTLASVYGVLTSLYGEKGEYEKAILYFTKHIKLDHTVARGWQNIGPDFGRVAEDPEVLSIFEEQYEQDKKNAILVENLGVSYFHLNRFESAAKIYSDCIKRFDKDYYIVPVGGGKVLTLSSCYRKLAVAKYMAKDPVGAKSILNESIDKGIADETTVALFNELFPQEDN
ncbi:tetratricopeptide repeat protein [Methylomonas sp. AM2-LC]|uniref:tetratricopeptide repeat protein n=1 Tax=Methylomonas sp. AM2-LC TaxID=3153301 RepID=UPI0032672BCA